MRFPFTTRFRAAEACLTLAVLSAVMLGACSSQSNQARPAITMGAVPITAAEATQETVPVDVTAIGTGEAYSTITIASQVAGQIEKVNFIEGQFVKAGDVLFLIDPRPFQAALKQAEANLAKDTAQSKYAQSQEARFQKLYQSGIVSADQYDQYESNSQALQAAVQADQAAVQTARIQLGYCTITSPVNGKTGSLLVHPGSVVKVSDTNLIVVNQISPIYVDFSVPEQYLAEIKQRFTAGRVPVTAQIPEEKDPAAGYLSFINNTVDNTTGTVLLKGTFSNADHRLWPGQFVNVNLVLNAQPNATVVPSQAVQTGQNGMYVYVVNPDMTVALRPVQVGTTYHAMTVITQGVRPGEKVVTDGQLRLYPGAKVSFASGQGSS